MNPIFSSLKTSPVPIAIGMFKLLSICRPVSKPMMQHLPQQNIDSHLLTLQIAAPVREKKFGVHFKKISKY